MTSGSDDLPSISEFEEGAAIANPLVGDAPSTGRDARMEREGVEHHDGRKPLEPPTIGDAGSQREISSTVISGSGGRADTVIDFGRAGDLEVRAASLRGRAHRYSDRGLVSKPRQDDYCLQLSEDGCWLVIFVTDGVGSGSDSHTAAAIASRRGCRLVVDVLNEGTHPADVRWDADIAPKIAGYIVHEARRRMHTTEPTEAPPLDTADVAAMMATTAVTGIIRTEADIDATVPYYAAMLAGDSSIWTMSNRGWQSLTPIKNAEAEIASNVVRGLPYVGESMAFAGVLAAEEALFLMTDGLGDPLGSGQGEVGIYLGEQWRRPPGPYEFASTLDFFRKTFDDDRTAVGIWATRRKSQ